jgi:hypothetical protein
VVHKFSLLDGLLLSNDTPFLLVWLSKKIAKLHDEAASFGLLTEVLLSSVHDIETIYELSILELHTQNIVNWS